MTRSSSNRTTVASVAGSNLRIDYETAQVLSAFDSAGVPCLLLKGRSIASWLYPEGGAREYMDQDLMVPPIQEAAAARVLTGLGFVASTDERERPAWWKEHAVGWVQHAVTWQHPNASFVDLHHTLAGVGVDPETLWDVLFGGAEWLQVGTVNARVLSIPARAMHVAMHAAQHGGLKGLRDLDRALELVDRQTWQAAAGLAERLLATEAFAAGLSMRPEGARLASSFGLPGQWSVPVQLRAMSAPPEALTVDRFVHAAGLRERLSIVRNKLLPPPAFMRQWSAEAQSGRRGLARAYVRRFIWVLGRSAPALSAWRAARRASRTRSGSG